MQPRTLAGIRLHTDEKLQVWILADMAHGPLVAAFELLLDDEYTQSDPHRIGRVAVVYKLPDASFLCHISGERRCQLAKGETAVVQLHLMVLRIHGTAIQVHGFSPIFGILACIHYIT